MQIEAEKRGEGRKAHSATTVWATVFPLWARVFPVALTVKAASRTLQRLDEGNFRVFPLENSVYLTKDRYLILVLTIYG